ncbi:MAG: Ig-like domain-containing protein [Saprospiraceae bacterium]|nr:Ig-like domain-containing protein [Saprospiraceae bacterium]
MKTKSNYTMKPFLTAILFFFLSNIHLNSQVTDINYVLDFNEDTQRFEVKLKVLEGIAGHASERVAFIQLLSLVVPTGNSIEMVQSNMPLLANSAYGGTIPAEWAIGTTIISPNEQPENDFYSISLDGGQTSYYNNLNPGDVVTLFSFTVQNADQCLGQVRFYDSSIDYDFNDPEWFSFGFQLGSNVNIHTGNLDATGPQIKIPEPTLYLCDEECITLVPETNLCVDESFSYLWSTGETKKYIEVCPTDTTTYTVHLLDPDGAIVSTDSVQVEKPETGTGGIYKTKLLLEYNEESSLYELKLYIVCGSATTYPQRIQFNSQITIVTPTGSIVSLVELFNPKENNQFYTGTIPILWDFGPKEIAPPIQPQLDFHTVFPNLSPPGAYNNLYEGDTVVLFSFDVEGVNPCDNEVRLYETGKDHTSEYSPSGGDYSQGFTFGGGIQTYSGNLYTPYKPNYITPTNIATICEEECIDLEPTFNCLEGVTSYEWSTGETTPNIMVCPEEFTSYYLLLKDDEDVVLDSLFVNVNVTSIHVTASTYEPCVEETVYLEGCPGPGVWEQDSGNPFGASLSPLAGGAAEITFNSFASSGIYVFNFFSVNGQKNITLTLNNSPLVHLNDTELCVGNSTQVLSNKDGTWSSSNESIASVNPYTGSIATHETGSVTFTFTDLKGCSSSTQPLEVVSTINASFLGSSQICIGGTSSVFPVSGGIWSSSNPVVAFIDNSGNVTGMNEGTTELIFIDEFECQSEPLLLTVLLPETDLIGPNEICVGETTEISPQTGGVWVSSDPGVATINNNGIITGVAAGFATFVFTNTSTTCMSNPSQGVTVFPGPVITLENQDICVGESTELNSNQDGSWESVNPGIAVYNPSTGLVTGISEGTASFVFTNTDGCQTESPSLHVKEIIETDYNGPSMICGLGITMVTPSTGGTWTSSNPAVATITNGGVVTGIQPGQAIMTFHSNTSDCDSEPILIIVGEGLSAPMVSQNGPICEGEDLMLITDDFEGATYAWTGPNNFTSMEQNPIITNVTISQSGEYCLRTTIGECESQEACIYVAIYPIPITPVANNNGPVCEGDQLLLTTEFVAGASYSWVGPNGFSSSIQNPTIINITSSDAGDYCVVITMNGCESEAGCTSVEVNPTPATPTASYNGPICEGEDFILTCETVQGATYAWSGPNAFTSNEQNVIVNAATPPESGTYCVYIDVNGCQSQGDCIDVYINETPATPTATNNGPICEGDNIELQTNVVVGANYLWTGPDGFTSDNQNPVITNATTTQAGDYCVTVIVDGCVSEEGCTMVTIRPNPEQPIVNNNSPFCEGEDLQLTADFIEGASYAWNGPNGWTSSDQNPILLNTNSSDNGTYCLEITVDGCISLEGCTDVIVNPTPSTPDIIGDRTICEGDNLFLTSEDIVGGSYQWTLPNGEIEEGQNLMIQTVTPEMTGTYCLIVTVDGCMSQQNCSDIFVNQNTLEVDISNTSPACIGDGVSLYIPQIDEATYVWTGPEGATYTGPEIAFIAGNIPEGTYTLEVSLGGCTATGSTEVVYLDAEEIILESNEVCVGESISISPVTGGTYTLSNPEVGFIDDGKFTALNIGSTDITFTKEASGCSSMSVTIDVKNCTELFSACDQITPDDIICDYNELSSISGTLLNEASEGNQPLGNLCESEDEAQNIAWLGFVALEGDYSIIIYTANCTASAGIIAGIQVGVYSDCSFTPESLVYCDSQFGVENFTQINSDQLVAGQTYFLYIDGLESSVCDYYISVDGNYDNTYCTELSKVTGVAYVDADENGVYDEGETLLRNAYISLNPGNFSVLTNAEGRYIINTPKGGATLTAKMYEGNWINNQLTIEDVSVFEDCVEDIDFGFVPNLFYQEAKISVTNSVTRCDWETRFYFTIENTGTIDIDAYFEFDFDDEATYFSTNLIGLQVAGNKAIGNLGTLKPFEVRQCWIKLKMPSGTANLPLLEFNTTLFNQEDMVMDEFQQSEQLRCSYDPNDKLTFPNREGDENLTLMDEDLEYTIRFQNNGNDTAFLVKIIDPLDPNIDPNSIRVIHSSHAVETCIENDNIIFLFENINLVDSMTNYDDSQGFVSFRCNPKEGRTEGTIVHNTADIIFDTNIPIVTNTTLNTLVSELCIHVTTELDVSICEGESYEDYEESGTYTEIFPLEYGCDSTVIIHLDVQGITYSSQEIEVCEDESVLINGQDYIFQESQELTDTMFSGEGCISNILNFDIIVHPVLEINIDTTICEGLDYNGLTESGIYTLDSFDVNTGCDILTIINLEVLPLDDPSCIVGVDDVESNLISIYPNPAQEVFYIESEYPLQFIEIYSTGLQKIDQYKGSVHQTKYEFTTENFTSGLYFLVIKTNGKTIYNKIVIE